MKRTFAAKTFSVRTCRPVTLAGPVEIKDYYPVSVQMFVAGAVAGRHFHSGATIGQNYHTGANAGSCHG